VLYKDIYNTPGNNGTPQAMANPSQNGAPNTKNNT
jgi:hypothetical protein